MSQRSSNRATKPARPSTVPLAAAVADKDKSYFVAVTAPQFTDQHYVSLHFGLSIYWTVFRERPETLSGIRRHESPHAALRLKAASTDRPSQQSNQERAWQQSLSSV